MGVTHTPLSEMGRAKSLGLPEPFSAAAADRPPADAGAAREASSLTAAQRAWMDEKRAAARSSLSWRASSLCARDAKTLAILGQSVPPLPTTMPASIGVELRE
jgi:hypothetical protein